MLQWLVIIARDRPDLWASWAAFYGGLENVDILLDRRQAWSETRCEGRADRRTHPDREPTLQERGFLVIPQSDMLGAPR